MTCSKSINFIAGPGDDARRIDRVTRKMFPTLPLSAVFRALRKGRIHINGVQAHYNTILRQGDTITVPESFPMIRKHTNNIDTIHTFTSVYETDAVLIINKQAGEALFTKNGLIHQIREYLEPSLETSLSFRPTFVHRLDRPSSGLLMCAKTLQAAQILSSLFQEQNIYKEYLTIVEGVIHEEALWEDHISRDTIQKKSEQSESEHSPFARTRIIPLGNNQHQTLLRVIIYTGKTHQIRVQAALHGHPVCGDIKYGRRGAHPMLLHAYKLALPENLPDFPSELTAALSKQQLTHIKTLFSKNMIDQSVHEDVQW